MFAPLLFGLLAASLACSAPSQDPLPESSAAVSVASTEAPAILERVAILGASASFGFNTTGEVGATVGMAELLDAMIVGEPRVVQDSASQFLFRNPPELGAQQIAKALEAEPTIVFAVDFLFWFAYDGTTDEEDRVRGIAKGLELLEQFDCHVVVGDVPDMSPAVGGWISDWNVPEPETRVRLNQMVSDWAAARENASYISLDDFVTRMRANAEMKVLDEVLEVGSTREFMHTDELHPTLHGIAILAVSALDAALEGKGEAERAAVNWDWRAAAQEVYDSKAEARAKAEERRRRREERKRAKEGGQ